MLFSRSACHKFEICSAFDLFKGRCRPDSREGRRLGNYYRVQRRLASFIEANKSDATGTLV